MSPAKAKLLAASALLLPLLLLAILPDTASAHPSMDSILWIMPAVISAHQSLKCDKVWSGPSENNDIVNCLSNVDRVRSQWHLLVFPSMNVLLLVILLVGFPIVFMSVICLRSCCKQTSEEKGAKARCCNWMWIVYALLWSIAMGFFVIFGAKLLMDSAPRIIDDVLTGPVQYFNTTADKILDFTSNWSTGERKPLESFNFDISTFYDVQDRVKNVLNDAKKVVLSQLDTIAIVSYVVSGLGIFMMFLMAAIAFLRSCIPCAPLFLSCIYWIFGMIFTVFGAGMSVLAFLFSTGCGEVELQHQRKPGVFQWYLLPFCKSKFDFVTINREVRSAELKFSKDACTELLKACDNKATEVANSSRMLWAVPGGMPNFGGLDAFKEQAGKFLPKDLGAGGLPSDFRGIRLPTSLDDLKIPKELEDKISQGFSGGMDWGKVAGALRTPLNCGRGITSADQCSSFSAMANVLIATTIKGDTMVCPAATESCTLAECAVGCRNDMVRGIARRILEGAMLARNASIALTYARPLLECNFVIDKVASGLTSCNDLNTGALLLGVGFFIGGLMFGLAIYVMFRGSCLWEKNSEESESSETHVSSRPPDEDHFMEGKH